jgi:hypothetical protein
MPDATTITTTLGALSMAEPALERLAGEKLPFQTAYRITKLKKAVTEEVKHFYEERNTLVKKYGSTNGKGPEDITVQPTSEHWPAFVSDVTELANVEVTIPLWPIDLSHIENLTIAAKDLELLEPLLKAEAPAAPSVPPTEPPIETK